jgi:hypothetical protein
MNWNLHVPEAVTSLRTGRSGERIQTEENVGEGGGGGMPSGAAAPDGRMSVEAKISHYKWKKLIFYAQRVLNYWANWKEIH